MTQSDLKNKIAQQIQFLTISGLDKESCLINLISIAEKYKQENYSALLQEETIKRLELMNKRLTKKEYEPKEKWLDNQDLMQLLHISKRTAQHYRDTKLLAFTQVGNKIYYKLTDIEELLETHYNPAKPSVNIPK